MTEDTINAKSRQPAGETSVARLMRAIGYPERASRGAVSSILRVDGVEVSAEEAGGRLVLSCELTDDESLLPKLAEYSAGRMLREDASLAYGNRRAILWQDAPADAGVHELKRLFETFMDSCDWWRDRVESRKSGGEDGEDVDKTMVIRP